MLKLNDKIVNVGSFPNKESYLPIKHLRVKPYNNIEWIYEGDHEFFQLALLKDYLDRNLSPAWLEVYYFPHSRMDRDNPDYFMSLRTATKLINQLDFDVVNVYEPHSDVSIGMLDKGVGREWCQHKISDVVKRVNATSVFFPDAGAAKRYSTESPYAVGFKKRDFKTGAINHFDLVGDVNNSVLIVDDLCSKGGTFIHSSKLLRKHGAKKVFLLVAHCENTVFQGDLFEYIDGMFIAPWNKMEKTNKKLYKQ